MRKILNILLVLMLLASVATVVLADEDDDNLNDDTNDGQNNHTGDNETGDQNHENETNDDYQNETEHEIEIMNSTLGAEIRLLQLEKALLTNLLKGTMTVQVLKGIGVNTTQLEAILADLHAVLDEVRAADPSANNSVQIFVELKNQSRNLTKQYRDTIRTLLDPATLKDIREQLRNITSNDLQNCSAKLRHRIRQLNWNQLYRFYGLVGESNMSSLRDYLNGNVTLDQLTNHLHKVVNQMTKEKQHEIFSEVKEENIKKKIRAHESMDDIKQHGKGNGNKH